MVTVFFSVEIESPFIAIEFNYKILNFNEKKEKPKENKKDDRQSVTHFYKSVGSCNAYWASVLYPVNDLMHGELLE